MNEPSDDVRRCARPTRSGKPCQAVLHGFDVSCKKHAAEGDDELARWFELGVHTGMRRGQQMADWSARHNKERIKELERDRKAGPTRWKAALNAFEITFDGRLSAARKAL